MFFGDDYKNFQIGDLVVYSEPRRFFTAEKEFHVIGLVTGIDAFFVRVLWSDSLHCLESCEDLKKID